MVSIVVRFMSLSGKFETVKEETFLSADAALEAVKAHALSEGYSNVKMVDDGDFDGVRFTARTPGGRGGRNVAFGDYDGDFDSL
jgi:hypothetical protein